MPPSSTSAIPIPRAAAAQVFAAVPLVVRYCPIIAAIREIAAGEQIQYLSFKFIGGMVDRYHQQNVEWVIDRAISGGASCMVETGYLYPGPNSVFDLHYSIRTEKHYFAARDNSTLEIVTNDRQRTTREMKLTNVFFYPEYVRDTLRRLRAGLPPIADLSDNAAAVALIEAGYAMSPLPAAARS